MTTYQDYIKEIEERKQAGLHPKPIDESELLSEIITQIKDTNNEQIIKVLSFILSKLDTLEVEQSKHKEMFYKVRKNLTDANDLINQILDVLEIENPELYNKTMKQYENSHMKNLVSTLDKHISELDDFSDEQVLDLLTQIVGDA